MVPPPRPSGFLPLAASGHTTRSPFGAAAPSILLAVVAAAAMFVWIFFGDVLPGGRWFAVHLFTLGVVTNLVLTFSEHFSRTVTRTPGERAPWWPAVTNAGIIAVLVGLPTGQRVVLVTGAVVLTGVVFAAYRRLRRMRRQAIGARFGWIVRVYERAHGAFIHGAVLGAVLGAAVATGPWYAAVRLAHLHANILGWGGLTLLATLVFFGPSMARTRIESGADARAARALRHGATGLTIAVAALIVTALPAAAGVAARLVAAGGLGIYAVAVWIVCVPVIRAASRARHSAQRPLIVFAAGWFLAVAVADVAIVATGAWRWLDALGVVAVAGVLAQAILATLIYLAPMLRGRTAEGRDAIRTRLDRWTEVRAVVVNLGVVLATLGALRLSTELAFGAIWWLLLAAAAMSTAA
ncbi:MAG: hypothetical protein WD011_03280, partial [Nitriliruptoraceae bacterium]